MRKGLVLTLAAAVLLAGGLVACERKPDLRPAAAPERPAPAGSAAAEAPKGAPKVKTNSDWAFGRGQNSVEIVHLPGGDVDRADLRLVCAKGDGFMIWAPTFKRETGRDRLAIEGGGEIQGLPVADVAKGVQATGPITGGLLAIVEGGKPLTISHGAQALGPLEAPPEGMRRAFADICRGLYRAGEV